MYPQSEAEVNLTVVGLTGIMQPNYTSPDYDTHTENLHPAPACGCTW